MSDARKAAAWEPGKCRVPMWMGGAPAGYCDKPAFGYQRPIEILEHEHGFYMRRADIPYCYGPCCPDHGGPTETEPRFFTDGLTEQGRQMWCCVMPDFINLQESPAGFSGNPFQARRNLEAAIRESRNEG